MEPLKDASGSSQEQGTSRKRNRFAPLFVGSVTMVLVLLIGAVVAGRWFAGSAYASVLTFNGHQITIAMALYGFIASVLPVWFLLEPRDYLSTYMKLGTIFLLVIGVFIVHPNIQFPMVTQFVHGGGPIIKGKLFPFLFVSKLQILLSLLLCVLREQIRILPEPLNQLFCI